jgi:DNA (cytosine-5)-methyltransferase 1
MNVLDLFAGCGGMSLGFQTAGFNITSHIEHDKSSYQTASRNVKPGSGFDGCMDIHDFNAGREDEFDVVIGGPPCQAYSLAGRGKLASVMGIGNAHLADSRSELYREYLRVVKEVMPRAVIMENVPEILSYGNLDIPSEICRKLNRLGYHCRFTILNAAEYGVPQYRERFFLIAIRKDTGSIPVFPSPTHKIPRERQVARIRMKNYIKKTDSKFAVIPPTCENYEFLPEFITTYEALADLPVLSTQTGKPWLFKNTTPLPYSMEPHSAYAKFMRSWPGFPKPTEVTANGCRNTPRDFPIFKKMKEGDKYPEAHQIATELFREKLLAFEISSGKAPEENEIQRIKKETIPPYDNTKFHDKWRKLQKNEPSHTVVAHLAVDTYSHIHYDSGQARAITVREAARLQSFPDSFQLPSSLADAFKQIGNAVPPLLAYHLARAVKSVFVED